jgi:hypothetical protein
MVAEATAREIGRVTLAESFALTALVALKHPERRSPYAVRWLLRLLEEYEHASIDEAALAAGRWRRSAERPMSRLFDAPRLRRRTP